VNTPRLPLLAVAAGAALLLLAVLYWMKPATVHASPPSLAQLKPTEPAKAAPVVAFTGAGGKLHDLGEFRGKLVVLNLWATWCGPCVKELPALATLQKALPKDRFVVVLVDMGRDTPAEAQAFLNSHDAGTLQTYVDPNAGVLRAFGGYGLPMSVLIDAQGREIARAEQPPDWSHPDSIEYLRQLATK
jgi:thiol-disulfide isomerase/thioredoxin